MESAAGSYMADRGHSFLVWEMLPMKKWEIQGAASAYLPRRREDAPSDVPFPVPAVLPISDPSPNSPGHLSKHRT